MAEDPLIAFYRRNLGHHKRPTLEQARFFASTIDLFATHLVRHCDWPIDCANALIAEAHQLLAKEQR